MTTKQAAKLTALRSEADLHGDNATVALCDRALAGDVEAAATLGVAVRAQRVLAASSCSKASRPVRRRVYGAQIDHPDGDDA